MGKLIKIIILILTVSSCTQESFKNKAKSNFKENKLHKEEKWIDSAGNVFIKTENQLYISPIKYHKTGKIYKIFLFNETSYNIKIGEDFNLTPNEFEVISLKDTDTLKLDNGVKFMFGETYGLEIEDKKSQVSGLGGDFLQKYNVPTDVEWAFIIVPVGKGNKN